MLGNIVCELVLYLVLGIDISLHLSLLVLWRTVGRRIIQVGVLVRVNYAPLVRLSTLR